MSSFKGFYKVPERKAPARVTLWEAGDNATDYGVHRWTERSVASIQSDYVTRGNMVGIDLEHSKSEGSPMADDPTLPTGGYCTLEFDPGGLDAVFYWSDVAVEQIETGQRLYTSPEYLTDPETNEIIGLIRVSLVHEPGTHHCRQLASKKKYNFSFPAVPQKTSVGIIPPRDQKLSKKIITMDQDLKLVGSVLLALQLAADQVGDENLKGMLGAALQQMSDALGDQAQAAIDAASVPEVEAEVEAPEAPAPVAAESAPAPSDPAKDPQKQMASRLAAVERQLQTLQGKGVWNAASQRTQAPLANTHGLTAAELQRCKAKKIDPAKYAESKSRIQK